MATLDELLFGVKLEAWRHKIFHIFHFLQCEMVLGIVNIPFNEYLMHLQREKLLDFNAFPVNLH